LSGGLDLHYARGMRKIPILAFTILASCSSKNDGKEDGNTGCHPTTAGGNCNLFEQCGCEEGEWCGLAFDDGPCAFFEDCFASPIPGVGPEEQCYQEYPNVGECDPGMDCFWMEHMYSYRCTEWCRTDEDCTVEGRTCTMPVQHATMYCTIPVTAPFNACNMTF